MRESLTHEQETFIRENHRELSVAELSVRTGSPPRFIYKFLYANELQPLDTFKERRAVRNRKGQKEGIFNVNERHDWFIG